MDSRKRRAWSGLTSRGRSLPARSCLLMMSVVCAGADLCVIWMGREPSATVTCAWKPVVHSSVVNTQCR